MAKQGDWVRIHSIILMPEQRSAAVPDDTKSVPLEQWTKGYLHADATLGSAVTVTTRTGRVVSGTLVDEHPHYSHSFGEFVPELQKAGDEAFVFLFGGDAK
ncbi:MAG TPA: 2-amino-4-oxopentanoate thiolase subunit OrtA [Clostridia bacterium]|nr:2-amino-4-oxopentanoate thiolase subunit OrtA [Clostridia bacterium]